MILIMHCILNRVKTKNKKKTKKIENYYVFKSVLESYVKEGVTKTYLRTTRVDKNESVCNIYASLVPNGECYLYHRSIVDNIKAVLPKLWESFTGKYIEMDFSQNISLKTKDEVQTTHFRGNNSPYFVPLWSLRMKHWVMFTTWVMILAMTPLSLTKCKWDIR